MGPTCTTDIEKCSKVREDRSFKVRERQVNKFSRLDSKSNNISFSHNNIAIDNNQAQELDNNNNTDSGNNQLQQGNNNKCIINLCKIPQNKGHESLLAIKALTVQ